MITSPAAKCFGRPRSASIWRPGSGSSLNSATPSSGDFIDLSSSHEDAPPRGGFAGGSGGGGGRTLPWRARRLSDRHRVRSRGRARPRAQAVHREGPAQGEADPSAPVGCLQPRGERAGHTRGACPRGAVLARPAHDRARRASPWNPGLPRSRPSSRAAAHLRVRWGPARDEREPLRSAGCPHRTGGHRPARRTHRARSGRRPDNRRAVLDDRRLHHTGREGPSRRRNSDRGDPERDRIGEGHVKIGVAADHAGQTLLATLVKHLRQKGHEVKQYGPPPDPDDDYPIIVRALAEAIASGEVERGVFTCGSGIGPAVAANKIAGIRATVVDNEWSARDAVEHVDVNLLTMGERVIGDELAKSILDAYLGATVQGGRHERRRKQIEAMEPVNKVTADSTHGMRRGV